MVMYYSSSLVYCVNCPFEICREVVGINLRINSMFPSGNKNGPIGNYTEEYLICSQVLIEQFKEFKFSNLHRNYIRPIEMLISDHVTYSYAAISKFISRPLARGGHSLLGVQLVQVKWISCPNVEANLKRKCSNSILE